MRYLPVILLALASTGCVGKAKYAALESQYEAVLKEKEEMATKLKACKEGMGRMKSSRKGR